jgi:hypothetical protein
MITASGTVTSVLAGLGALVILFLEGLCIRHHYRIWRSYGYLESARPTLALLIRVVTFSFLDVLAMMYGLFLFTTFFTDQTFQLSFLAFSQPNTNLQ